MMSCPQTAWTQVAGRDPARTAIGAALCVALIALVGCGPDEHDALGSADDAGICLTLEQACSLELGRSTLRDVLSRFGPGGTTANTTTYFGEGCQTAGCPIYLVSYAGCKPADDGFTFEFKTNSQEALLDAIRTFLAHTRSCQCPDCSKGCC